MDTQVYTLIYQPGYAGHFLTYLFSLDPSTAPHTPLSQEDVPSNRLELYSFDHAKKFNNWAEFHVSYKYQPDVVLSEYGQYPAIVWSIHPLEFIYSKLDCPQICYIADLSRTPFADFWLVKTKELWKQFPRIRPQEAAIEHNLRKFINS